MNDPKKVDRIKKELVEIKEMFSHLAEPTNDIQREELRKILENIKELETYINDITNKSE